MTTAVSREPATQTPVQTVMSLRAHALADRLERGAGHLAALAATLTHDEWFTPIPHDGRKVCTIVHHVASVYPVEIHLAQVLAEGNRVTGVTMDNVHEMNAAHATANPHPTKEEAIELLKKNSAEAAEFIRSLSDEQLDRAELASLYSDAPITCQFMLEDHAVRHSYHHLLKIRTTLNR